MSDQQIRDMIQSDAATLAKIIPAAMERYNCDARTAAKILASLYLA